MLKMITMKVMISAKKMQVSVMMTMVRMYPSRPQGILNGGEVSLLSSMNIFYTLDDEDAAAAADDDANAAAGSSL